REYLARVEHRAVPDSAQLATANLKSTQLFRFGKRHVVFHRVSVGFDFELIRPETVNHVEGRHVERNIRIVGQYQIRRFKTPKRWITIGELPLLRDDLHRKYLVAVGRPSPV